MDDPEQSRRAKPSKQGRIRLPTTQPARGLAALGLYALGIAALTLLLGLTTSGYALLVLVGILAAGLIVPFLLLGQRPDVPERTQRPSFPVLGTASDARDVPDRTAPQPPAAP